MALVLAAVAEYAETSCVAVPLEIALARLASLV